MVDAKQEKHSLFRKKEPLRVIAFITLWFFLFTNIFGEFLIEKAWAARTPLELPRVGSNKSWQTGFSYKEISVDTFTLPKGLGVIRERWRPEKREESEKKRIVIHIQDAHANYFAQKKIKDIIKHLRESYGIKIANLEGGKGEYNFAPFEKIEKNLTREKVSDYFLKEGMISGAEYFAINNPEKIELWGIEDTPLYLENLNIYKDTLKNEHEITNYLKSIESILTQLKKRIYQKELIEFDDQFNLYKSEKLDLKDYLFYLLKKARLKAIDAKRFPNIYLLSQSLNMEEKIDFEKATSQRNKLIDRLGRNLSDREIRELAEKAVLFRKEIIGRNEFYEYLTMKSESLKLDLGIYPDLELYIAYVGTYHVINKTLIDTEIGLLESAIKNTIFKSDIERRLDVISRNFTLTKNIFSISLTREDYKYFRENRSNFRTRNHTSFIKEFASRFNIKTKLALHIENLDLHIDSMADFYECSFKRDKAFLKNIKFETCGEIEWGAGDEVAILVTGGFHTDNLCELFRKNNIAYVSLMPNFNSEDGYECPYQSLLKGTNNKLFHAIVENGHHDALALYAHFCKDSWLVYENMPEAQWEKALEAFSLIVAAFFEGKAGEVGNTGYTILLEEDEVPVGVQVITEANIAGKQVRVCFGGQRVEPIGEEETLYLKDHLTYSQYMLFRISVAINKSIFFMKHALYEEVGFLGFGGFSRLRAFFAGRIPTALGISALYYMQCYDNTQIATLLGLLLLSIWVSFNAVIYARTHETVSARKQQYLTGLGVAYNLTVIGAGVVIAIFLPADPTLTLSVFSLGILASTIWHGLHNIYIWEEDLDDDAYYIYGFAKPYMEESGGEEFTTINRVRNEREFPVEEFKGRRVRIRSVSEEEPGEDKVEFATIIGGDGVQGINVRFDDGATCYFHMPGSIKNIMTDDGTLWIIPYKIQHVKTKPEDPKELTLPWNDETKKEARRLIRNLFLGSTLIGEKEHQLCVLGILNKDPFVTDEFLASIATTTYLRGDLQRAAGKRRDELDQIIEEGRKRELVSGERKVPPERKRQVKVVENIGDVHRAKGSERLRRKISPYEEALIYENRAYIVFSQAPRKGAIYRIVDRPPEEAFLNLPAMADIYAYIDTELQRINKLELQRKPKEASQARIDLFIHLHELYHGNNETVGLQVAQLFEEQGEYNKFLQEVEKSGLREWLVRRSNSLGLKNVGIDPEEWTKEEFHALERFYSGEDSVLMSGDFDLNDDVVLLHGTYNNALSMIIALKKLASPEYLESNGLRKTFGGESGGWQTSSPKSVSFRFFNPRSRWYGASRTHLRRGGYGRKMGFEYPVALGITKRLATVMAIADKLSVGAGTEEVKIYKYVALDKNGINCLVVPYFVMAEWRVLLDEHGLDHIKVVPLLELETMARIGQEPSYHEAEYLRQSIMDGEDGRRAQINVLRGGFFFGGSWFPQSKTYTLIFAGLLETLFAGALIAFGFHELVNIIPSALLPLAYIALPIICGFTSREVFQRLHLIMDKDALKKGKRPLIKKLGWLHFGAAIFIFAPLEVQALLWTLVAINHYVVNIRTAQAMQKIISYQTRKEHDLTRKARILRILPKSLKPQFSLFSLLATMTSFAVAYTVVALSPHLRIDFWIPMGKVPGLEVRAQEKVFEAVQEIRRNQILKARKIIASKYGVELDEVYATCDLGTNDFILLRSSGGLDILDLHTLKPVERLAEEEVHFELKWQYKGTLKYEIISAKRVGVSFPPFSGEVEVRIRLEDGREISFLYNIMNSSINAYFLRLHPNISVMFYGEDVNVNTPGENFSLNLIDGTLKIMNKTVKDEAKKKEATKRIIHLLKRAGRFEKKAIEKEEIKFLGNGKETHENQLEYLEDVIRMLEEDLDPTKRDKKELPRDVLEKMIEGLLNDPQSMSPTKALPSVAMRGAFQASINIRGKRAPPDTATTWLVERLTPEMTEEERALEVAPKWEETVFRTTLPIIIGLGISLGGYFLTGDFNINIANLWIGHGISSAIFMLLHIKGEKPLNKELLAPFIVTAITSLVLVSFTFVAYPELFLLIQILLLPAFITIHWLVNSEFLARNRQLPLGRRWGLATSIIVMPGVMITETPDLVSENAFNEARKLIENIIYNRGSHWNSETEEKSFNLMEIILSSADTEIVERYIAYLEKILNEIGKRPYSRESRNTLAHLFDLITNIAKNRPEFITQSMVNNLLQLSDKARQNDFLYGIFMKLIVNICANCRKLEVPFLEIANMLIRDDKNRPYHYFVNSIIEIAAENPEGLAAIKDKGVLEVVRKVFMQTISKDEIDTSLYESLTKAILVLNKEDPLVLTSLISVKLILKEKLVGQNYSYYPLIGTIIEIARSREDLRELCLSELEDLMMEDGLPHGNVYKEVYLAIIMLNHEMPGLVEEGSFADFIVSMDRTEPSIFRHSWAHYEIYKSENFKRLTQNLSPIHKFSLAVAVYHNLMDMERALELTDNNIALETEKVLRERKESVKREIISGRRKIVNIIHGDSEFDLEAIEAVERDTFESESTVGRIYSYKEEGTKQPILNCIAGEDEEESVPLTVLCEVHGGTKKIWLRFGHVGSEATEASDDPENYISYEEMGDALLKRHALHNDLKDAVIINDGCNAYFFCFNLLQYLLREGVPVEDLPLVIATNNKGRLGYDIGTLIRSLRKVMTPGKPILFETMLDAEEDLFYGEDFAVFIKDTEPVSPGYREIAMAPLTDRIIDIFAPDMDYETRALEVAPKWEETVFRTTLPIIIGLGISLGGYFLTGDFNINIANLWIGHGISSAIFMLLHIKGEKPLHKELLAPFIVTVMTSLILAPFTFVAYPELFLLTQIIFLPAFIGIHWLVNSEFLARNRQLPIERRWALASIGPDKARETITAISARIGTSTELNVALLDDAERRVLMRALISPDQALREGGEAITRRLSVGEVEYCRLFMIYADTGFPERERHRMLARFETINNERNDEGKPFAIYLHAAQIEGADILPEPGTVSATPPRNISEYARFVSDIVREDSLRPGVLIITDDVIFNATMRIAQEEAVTYAVFATGCYINRGYGERHRNEHVRNWHSRTLEYLEAVYPGEHFERVIILPSNPDISTVRHEIVHDASLLSQEENVAAFNELVREIEAMCARSSEFRDAYRRVSRLNPESHGADDILREAMCVILSGQITDEDTSPRLERAINLVYSNISASRRIRSLFESLGFILSPQEPRAADMFPEGTASWFYDNYIYTRYKAWILETLIMPLAVSFLSVKLGLEEWAPAIAITIFWGGHLLYRLFKVIKDAKDEERRILALIESDLEDEDEKIDAILKEGDLRRRKILGDMLSPSIFMFSILMGIAVLLTVSSPWGFIALIVVAWIHFSFNIGVTEDTQPSEEQIEEAPEVAPEPPEDLTLGAIIVAFDPDVIADVTEELQVFTGALDLVSLANVYFRDDLMTSLLRGLTLPDPQRRRQAQNILTFFARLNSPFINNVFLSVRRNVNGKMLNVVDLSLRNLQDESMLVRMAAFETMAAFATLPEGPIMDPSGPRLQSYVCNAQAKINGRQETVVSLALQNLVYEEPGSDFSSLHHKAQVLFEALVKAAIANEEVGNMLLKTKVKVGGRKVTLFAKLVENAASENALILSSACDVIRQIVKLSRQNRDRDALRTLMKTEVIVKGRKRRLADILLYNFISRDTIIQVPVMTLSGNDLSQQEASRSNAGNLISLIMEAESPEMAEAIVEPYLVMEDETWEVRHDGIALLNAMGRNLSHPDRDMARGAHKFIRCLAVSKSKKAHEAMRQADIPALLAESSSRTDFNYAYDVELALCEMAESGNHAMIEAISLCIPRIVACLEIDCDFVRLRNKVLLMRLVETKKTKLVQAVVDEIPRIMSILRSGNAALRVNASELIIRLAETENKVLTKAIADCVANDAGGVLNNLVQTGDAGLCKSYYVTLWNLVDVPNKNLRSGIARSIPRIASTLTCEHEQTAAFAASFLKKLAARDEKMLVNAVCNSVPQIVDYVTHDNDVVSEYVRLSLLLIAGDNEKLLNALAGEVERLVSYFDHENAATRHNAREFIIQLVLANKPILIQAVRDAMPKIVGYLDNPDENVSAFTMDTFLSLTASDNRVVLDSIPLVRASLRSRNAHTRRNTQIILVQLALMESDTLDRSVASQIPAILVYLEDPDERTRIAAQETIQNLFLLANNVIDDAILSIIPGIMSCATHNDSVVAYNAEELLRDIIASGKHIIIQRVAENMPVLIPSLARANPQVVVRVENLVEYLAYLISNVQLNISLQDRTLLKNALLYAYARLKGENETISNLLSQNLSHDNEEVREAAKEALDAFHAAGIEPEIKPEAPLSLWRRLPLIRDIRVENVSITTPGDMFDIVWAVVHEVFHWVSDLGRGEIIIERNMKGKINGKYVTGKEEPFRHPVIVSLGGPLGMIVALPIIVTGMVSGVLLLFGVEPEIALGIWKDVLPGFIVLMAFLSYEDLMGPRSDLAQAWRAFKYSEPVYEVYTKDPLEDTRKRLEGLGERHITAFHTTPYDIAGKEKKVLAEALGGGVSEHRAYDIGDDGTLIDDELSVIRAVEDDKREIGTWSIRERKAQGCSVVFVKAEAKDPKEAHIMSVHVPPISKTYFDDICGFVERLEKLGAKNIQVVVFYGLNANYEFKDFIRRLDSYQKSGLIKLRLTALHRDKSGNLIPYEIGLYSDVLSNQDGCFIRTYNSAIIASKRVIEEYNGGRRVVLWDELFERDQEELPFVFGEGEAYSVSARLISLIPFVGGRLAEVYVKEHEELHKYLSGEKGTYRIRSRKSHDNTSPTWPRPYNGF